MNKDTVVASVIGFGLGLVAAIALWVVPRVLPAKQANPVKTTASSAPDAQKPDTATFTLSSPTEGQIVGEAKIKIAGTAKRDSVVVVSTAAGAATLTPDEQGTFSTELDVTLGVNRITVANYGAHIEEIKEVLVYYYQDQI